MSFVAVFGQGKRCSLSVVLQVSMAMDKSVTLNQCPQAIGRMAF